MHKKSLLIVAAFSIFCVLVAIISQYQFNMQPCPWCILQRIIFVAIAISCFALYLINSKITSIAVVTMLSTIGQIAAIYQFFVASESNSCKLSLAEKFISQSKLDIMIPFLFEIKTSCADAVVKIAGINYEVFSFIAFSLISTTIVLMDILPKNKIKA